MQVSLRPVTCVPMYFTEVESYNKLSDKLYIHTIGYKHCDEKEMCRDGVGVLFD